MVALSTTAQAMAPLEAPDLAPYIARLLGWDQLEAISRALESVAAWVDGKAQLSLVGAGLDMAQVGYAIHRRLLRRAPFIVLDRRRKIPEQDARSPASRTTVADAMRAARGGTVFIRGSRFAFHAADWQERAPDVRVMLHTAERYTTHAVMPRPIVLRSLAHRSREDRARIVAETVPEVRDELEVTVDLPDEHREWVARTSKTVHDVERSVARLLASLSCRTMVGAAAKIGCESISLRRWLTRAGFAWPPLVAPMVLDGEEALSCR